MPAAQFDWRPNPPSAQGQAGGGPSLLRLFKGSAWQSYPWAWTAHSRVRQGPGLGKSQGFPDSPPGAPAEQDPELQGERERQPPSPSLGPSPQRRPQLPLCSLQRS